jgi:hypothetical protein
MYPGLTQAYSSVIEKPMDFGSLLLLVLRNEVGTDELNEMLHLVFENALKFNQSSPLMVAITLHLKAFSSALFEEILKLPFENYSSQYSINKSKIFQTRQNYLRFVSEIYLNGSELKKMLSIFNDIDHALPTAISDVVHETVQLIKSMLYQGNEPPCFEASLTLKQILSRILATTSSTTTNEQKDSLVNCFAINLCIEKENSFKASTANTSTTTTSTHASCLEYLTLLDDEVAELTICVFERVLRGSTCSSVWAKPFQFVWAQPIKENRVRATWWPGFIYFLIFFYLL